MLWKALEKALRFAFTNSKKTRERSCSSFVFCVVGALGISWRFFSYFRRTAFGWASGPSEKSPGQSGKKKTWWNFYFYLPFILFWKALEKALRFAFTSSKNSRTARRSHLHSFFKKEMKALPFCFEARKKKWSSKFINRIIWKWNGDIGWPTWWISSEPLPFSSGRPVDVHQFMANRINSDASPRFQENATRCTRSFLLFSFRLDLIVISSIRKDIRLNVFSMFS